MKKFWEGLSPREKSYLVIMVVFLSFVALFLTFRRINQYFADLAERSESAETRGREYQLLQSIKTGEGQQLDSMLPTIEGLLKNLQLRDKIGNLTSSDTTVQEKYLKREVKISIREVPAAAVLDFIRQVEQSTMNLYKIEQFAYRPVLKKPGIYDFNLNISAFQRKKTDGK